MFFGQFCLGNNVPIHIRENIDFPQQKCRQLLSAEVNLEGWINQLIILLKPRADEFYRVFQVASRVKGIS